MKFILWFNFFILTLCLSPTSWAQGAKGGNGGSGEEISYYTHLRTMSQIVLSPVGQKIFGDITFDRTRFKNAVREVRISVNDSADALIDRFGKRRDCLNTFSSESNLIQCRHGLFKEYSGKLEVIYAILFHEVLNTIGVELPDLSHGSIYELSKRFLVSDIGSFLRKGVTVVHPSCKLALVYLATFHKRDLPLEVSRILNIKGYTLIGNALEANRSRDRGIDPDSYLTLSIDFSSDFTQKSFGVRRVYDRKGPHQKLGTTYSGMMNLNLFTDEEMMIGGGDGYDPTHVSTPVQLSCFTFQNQYQADGIVDYTEALSKSVAALPACGLL